MPFKKGHPGGPGRPRKSDKYAGAVAAAENRIVDRLPEIIDNMFHLAMGGYERVEEQWAPAGTLRTASGEKLFPTVPTDEMVLIKRIVTIADKDRMANQYLIDRVAGKPIEKQEVDQETIVRIIRNGVQGHSPTDAPSSSERDID